MVHNLATKLESLREYKENIDHGFLLKPETYKEIRYLLHEKNFHLSKDGDPNVHGSIHVRTSACYEVFVTFNIQTLTHGFSYFRTNNVINFLEAYDERIKAEEKRKKFTAEKCTYLGIAIGTIFEAPVIMGILTMNFPYSVLAVPPLLGATSGYFVGRNLARKLELAEGKAHQNLWKEMKGIKGSRGVRTNWSALEEALK
jgi:hypothetical protein